MVSGQTVNLEVTSSSLVSRLILIMKGVTKVMEEYDVNIEELQNENRKETNMVDKYGLPLVHGTYVLHQFSGQTYLLNTITGEIKYVCSNYTKVIGTEEEYYQSDKYKRLQDEQSRRVTKQKEVEEFIKKDKPNKDGLNLISDLKGLIKYHIR